MVFSTLQSTLSGELSIYHLFLVPALALLLTFFAFILKGADALNTAKQLFKVNIVTDTLAALLDDCVYDAKRGISSKRVEEAGLIYDWNRFSGNDYIKGKYKGHEIELSDISLEKETTTGSGDDQETYTEPRFHGQWLTCKLDKTLPAVVRLRERMALSKEKSNVETENTAFNKKYQIYTDDPHSMFYVLTPHFMEYIVAADKKAHARTFFCFKGDIVHIAFDNNRDLFEGGRHKTRHEFSAPTHQGRNEVCNGYIRRTAVKRPSFLGGIM